MWLPGGSNARNERSAVRMTRYALQRLAASVPLLFVISLLCFALLHLAPGGPFERIGPNVHPEDVQRIKH